jgi:hypothetical protein
MSDVRCARAASGHATVPPRSEMNSRRRMCRPGHDHAKSGAKANTQRLLWHATRCPLWVRSGHFAKSGRCPRYPRKRTWISRAVTSALCQKQTFRAAAKIPYSISWSARDINDAGIVSPSAFAVVKLMMNSNLVGCSTGISPGFAPRKILSTMPAARRYRSGKFGP